MKNDLIINPEKKKKSPLLIGILTLVIGCMLLTGELDVVKIACIITGAVALVIGLFNVFSKQLTKYPLWVAHYNVSKPWDNGKWKSWVRMAIYKYWKNTWNFWLCR